MFSLCLLSFCRTLGRNSVYGRPVQSPPHLSAGFLGFLPLVILRTARLQISNYFRDSCSFSGQREAFQAFAALHITKAPTPRLLFYLWIQECGHVFSSCELWHMQREEGGLNYPDSSSLSSSRVVDAGW